MTENRIIYGMIFFVTIVFVFLFEHHATYSALYAVLLLPAVSALVLVVSKKKMIAVANLDACIIKKGEQVRYIVHIKNNSSVNFKAKAVLDKRLRGFVSGTKNAAFYLPSRRGGEAVYVMDFKYRGIFSISAAHIWIYDFLGIFRLRIKPPEPLELTVQPCVHTLGGWSALPQNASNKPSEFGFFGADSSDFPDFSKYSPSEGFRRIHWGLSAKRGELISKKYKETAKPAIAVIIDNTAFSAKTSLIDAAKCGDKLIEAAAAVVHYYTAASVSVYLDFVGGGQGVFSDAFEALYAVISDIRFDRQADFSDFAAQSLEKCSGVDDVCIFAQSLTNALTDVVNERSAAERNIAVFHYVPAKKRDAPNKTVIPPDGAVCFALPESAGVVDVLNQYFIGMV